MNKHQQYARGLSQAELDAELDCMAQEDANDGPRWDALYAEWEARA